MAIGPGGSPELVAFSSRWFRRVRPSGQQPAQLPSPRAGGEGRGPDAAGRSPEQRGAVYPVLELGRFTEYGDLVESSMNPPSSPLLPRRHESEECGCFQYRPEWLRRFRHPVWVLVSLCAIELTQSFVNNGVLSVVLPTIERRFNLSSFETGIILSVFNVVNCVFIVPVAFLGSTRNKPVIIASGMALASAGSLTFFLAYALAPSYAYGTELLDLCYTMPPPANTTVAPCIAGTSMRRYRFLLIIGSMLQGAGATPLHTLGMSFLDENLPVRLTSCFLGTYSAMAVLGPALGFLVAGYFLSVFVDLKDVSSIGLTSQSSMWIGAWWVGFLVAAVLGAIVTIPMAAFPKHLPSFHQCQMVRRLHGRSKGNDEDTTYGQYVSDLPRAILALLKNATFVMLTLASATEAMVGTAVAAFSVKFFEAEFAMTPSKTAAALGCILIPAGVGGTVMGGALVSLMELPVRTILKMCCVMSIVPWLCMWVFVLHCPTPTFFRGEVRSSNRTVDFTSDCNEDCHCRAELLDPICSVENVVYPSPCFAGCAEREVIPNPDDDTWEMQVYKNCSCVPIPLAAPSNESAYDFEATRLKCPTDCNLLVLYMVVIFICVFFSLFNAGPIITVMMRCVEEKERAVGLALKWVTIRIVGNIPAPLLLGSVIDGSCLLWQEVCSERGACLLYNNELLALNMLEFLVPAKTSAIFLYYAAFATLRDQGNDVE